MIAANNVTLRVGKKALFEDVNIKFTEGNCYGMIGANGAGKSTFLKILSGQLEPTNGDVTITPGQRLSFLEQDHFKYDSYPVLDTVIMGNARLYEIMKEKEALYAKEDFTDEDGIKASELEGEFAEMNGWEAETDAEQLLNGLGIEPELQAIADLCDSGEYSNYLKSQYLRGKYKPSKVHELIKDLDSKIVVTTNFDKLYEGLCHEPEYLTFDYTDTRSIIGSIKAPENIIIKAHGSIDDTEKLIFTAKQYYQAQEQYPEFYHLMTALFLTHTVVFFGYSLNDPDINLLLQFLHNTANSSCPHYMIDKKGNKPQMVKHWKDTYNVSLLEYGDDYSCLESSLEELRDLVFELRAERGMP